MRYGRSGACSGTAEPESFKELHLPCFSAKSRTDGVFHTSSGSIFGMRLLATLLSFSFSVVGCTESVIVVDSVGKPVQGAVVYSVNLSMNGPKTKTDANGKAVVPLIVGGERMKWVSIDKAGFDPVHVNMPSKWPLRVTLAPTGTANFGIQLTTQP